MATFRKFVFATASFVFVTSAIGQNATVAEIIRLHPAIVVNVEVPTRSISTPLNSFTLALHLVDVKLSAGANLTIKDADDKIVGQIAGPADVSDIWMPPASGKKATVRCSTSGSGEDCSATVDEYARGLGPSNLRLANQPNFVSTQICGSCGLEEVLCRPAVTAAARAIARITVNGTRSCTGFLVGQDGFLLTNKHCINGKDEARKAVFEFDADEAKCDTDCSHIFHASGKIAVMGSQWIDDDDKLDVTVVRIRDSAISGITPLGLRKLGPHHEENLYMVQHPLGESKKVAFDYVRQDAALACHDGGAIPIGYNIDTRNGSSGSPVLSNDDNEVVAIHTCSGCPNRGVSSSLIYQRFQNELPASSFR